MSEVGCILEGRYGGGGGLAAEDDPVHCGSTLALGEKGKLATAKKSSKRKHGPKASSKVKRAMRERKRGTLRSGGSGKKVKSRKQAIAIGLSEARRSGAKVPPRKKEPP